MTSGLKYSRRSVPPASVTRVRTAAVDLHWFALLSDSSDTRKATSKPLGQRTFEQIPGFQEVGIR